MAIQQVKAQINGVWHTLTYDASSGTYKATITAPGATSYNQSGGYYNVTVQATNTAGTTTTADGGSITGLRLVVRERVAPVITILSPTSGAHLANNLQPVVFTVIDEENGSGVNLSSVTVKLDGATVSSGELQHSVVTGGYSFTYTPAQALSNGAHTVTISASDNDGNAAQEKSTTFEIDTVAPTINITSPPEGLITNKASIIVAGNSNDVNSSPVTVTTTLNAVDQGPVTLQPAGIFSKEVSPLIEGTNIIKVTSTDAAGNSSSITRTVILDTSVPQVVSASITPNPADAGATVIISVVVAG